MRFVLLRRAFATVLIGLAVIAVIAVVAVVASTKSPAAAPAGGAASHGTASGQAVSAAPRRSAKRPAQPAPAQATNTAWSGSVVDTRSTAVHAQWTEPQVKCGPAKTYGAIWVGIDGDGSRTVEQTGTQESCDHGHVSVDGWYQMYPKPAVGLSAARIVRPGDVIRATVAYEGTGTYSLELQDVSRHWTATERLSNPAARRASAEVVIETPASHTPNLNHFGTVTFTSVTVNHLSLSHWSASTTEDNLVAGNGTPEDTVSTLSAASFKVKWNN
jgi:hypothetical protein